MNNRVSAGLLALLLGGSVAARAQINATQPSGSWFIATLQLPGTPEHKLGGYAEVQVRTNGVFRQYFYHELKAEVSYDIDPNFSVLVGGGRYVTAGLIASRRACCFPVFCRAIELRPHTRRFGGVWPDVFVGNAAHRAPP